MRFRRFITAFWPLLIALLLLVIALLYFNAVKPKPTVVNLARGEGRVVCRI